LRWDAPHIEVENRAQWRAWLAANHATCTGAWLVAFQKNSGRGRIGYDEAVEEALCFGWIDGVSGKVDDLRAKPWFCPRRPKSGWSKVNKDRVQRLIDQGLMTSAGLAVIEAAKQSGARSLLDDVEAMVIPADFAMALDANPVAPATWLLLTRYNNGEATFPSWSFPIPTFAVTSPMARSA